MIFVHWVFIGGNFFKLYLKCHCFNDYLNHAGYVALTILCLKNVKSFHITLL